METQYQVEYQLNGMPSSFEFFLFVNPLGMKCYQSEQELIASLAHISSKVDVSILTFHNQNTVDHFMEQLEIHDADIQLRNQLYEVVYHAALAYKAATLQGKKLGRSYLLRIQEFYNQEGRLFDEEAAFEIAKEVGLDVQIFKHDLSSDFVRNLFIRDQQIAREMSVVRTPALIIFQNESGEDGIILKEQITKERIMEELDNIMENYYDVRNEEVKELAAKYKPILSVIHKKRQSKN